MKDEITVADDLLFHTVEKLKQLDHANLTDEQERTRRELAIYKGYFDVLAGIVKNPHSDGKTETAREYVGQHIHPGYMAMSDAIALYTNDALNIPTNERLDLVRPIGELMLLIGIRWNDANNAALNVRACFDDVQDKIATLDNVQTMTHDAAARFMADIDTLRQTLRQRLIELSAVLMGAPASGVDSETLAAVQDVAHDVRAARADIAAVGADAHAGRVAAESVDARLPKPRADKGKKHHTRKKISGAWISAADVAKDFNKAAFKPKCGKKKVGTCTEPTINLWDAKHPDYEHKNKWGYYAQLRVDSNLKNEYYEVLARWNEHYEAYKRWDKQHPGVKFRGMIRTDIDPERIGIDADGNPIIQPVSDDQKRRTKHVMYKKGISTKNLRSSYL